MEKKIVLYIALILVILAVFWVGKTVLQYAGSAGSIVPLIFNQEPITEGESGEENGTLPLSLPEGFSISVFAEGLGKPRVIIRGPAGNLLVSIPSEGKVVALPDRDGDGRADEVAVVIEGLNRPHGLATRCFPVDAFAVEFDCYLFIAETDKVSYFEYDRENLKAANGKKIIDLPGGGNHFTRTILFMPHPFEDTLLTSVGSSCNVCNEDDSRRASIIASDFLGENVRTFAKGLRNAVFMAIHPVSGDIWVTEMGRDGLGDDIPPDEINIVEEGGNYGWPICLGRNIHDTEFDQNTYIRAPCQEPFEIPSYIDIPAHSAPLGLSFVPEEGWPEDYRHDLLVAYHGSWNRSIPTGYKIVRFDLDEEGNLLSREDFITGWLTEDYTVLGRPVDIIAEPGGIIYISDDASGVIYRVVRK